MLSLVRDFLRHFMPEKLDLLIAKAAHSQQGDGSRVGGEGIVIAALLQLIHAVSGWAEFEFDDKDA